eukprot:scaffold20531_cov67-Cyclotella_meneghiniana.AAC.1
MKLSANIIVAAGILGHTVSAYYYPNWTLLCSDPLDDDTCFDESVTCLHESEGWERIESDIYWYDPTYGNVRFRTPTFEDCSKLHFHTDYEVYTCLRNGDYGGTNKWYKDEISGKCVQDCQDVGGGCTNPGTIVYPTDGVILYDTPSTCCESGLSHVAKAYCVAQSLGEEYKGSNKYYVEDTAATRLIGSIRSFEYPEGTRCVQDCVDMDGPAGPCSLPGGIVTDSSVTLYDDAKECCAHELHHIDSELCQSNSYFWSLGSKKWYPDIGGAQCVMDRDGCPVLTHEGVMCKNVPIVTTKLYDSIKYCCALGLSSITQELCVARTSGVSLSSPWASSSDGDTSRRRTTEASRCIKECTEDELASNAGGPEPYCGKITNKYTKLYESADACCTWALPWINHDLCKSNTLGLPTEKWFLSNPTDTVCSARTAAPLNSLLIQVHLNQACCSGALWWINANSCASRTIGGYTNLWYAGNDGSKCLKDCDATAAGASEECAGHPEDMQAAIYQDYASCCANKFWWDRENCLVQTTGEAFAGSAKYYVDWVRGKCVQDCDGDAPCGGLAPSWITVKHDSVETCCSSHLYWVAKENCIAA